MKTWLDDSWPSPWPAAVGFCGAQTALDHLFWFLPFIKLTLRRQMPRSTPLPPPRPDVAWQVACRVRAGPLGASRLARCFLCDVLEITPPGPPHQHFRQRWARPCAKCTRLAHRICLESDLRAAERGDWSVCVDESLDVSVGGSTGSSWQSRPAPTRHAGAPGARPLRCGSCGREFNISRRFPESLPELVHATLQEWRWLLRRLFCLFMFFVWLYTLAEHYTSGVSRELCILLAFTACMMSISVSERFHRGIQMIWNTPHRWLYFQLFFLFAVLFYMVSLRALSPSLWEAFAERQPLLLGFWKLHSVVHTSFLGTLLLSSFALLYVATASGVIFLFWKTAMRVTTVADVDGVCSKGGHVQCGLCQLGLCLDNTCM